MRSAFIFRRDLRLVDNLGLLAAAKESDEVVCCFVLDPRQAQDHPYRSLNALEFMFRSLLELDEELHKRGARLVVFEGSPEDAVRVLVKDHGVKAVHVNEDYTPFSIERDKALKTVCESLGIAFHQHFDLLLSKPGEVLTKQGTPYSVFTPFYKAAIEHSVPAPQGVPDISFVSIKAGVDLKEAFTRYVSSPNPDLAVRGGRKEGLELLDRAIELSEYGKRRNFPSQSYTTRLSAHHKFGTVSIRETYHAAKEAFGPGCKLISELYWRDFYSHISYHHPRVFGEAFREDYSDVEWDADEEKLKKWCDGLTGFPIVDAGMRELVKTGYMHNRVRMIVASFLTKDLHLDWLLGERFFAQHLVDYDPAVNNGSWQWASSTGADGAPYFRIFNPWSQQVRFDEDCEYIKKWVPELADIPAKALHKLFEQRPLGMPDSYPKPMVDHSVEREEALRRFKVL